MIVALVSCCEKIKCRSNKTFRMLSFIRFKTPVSVIKREILPNYWLRTIVTGNPHFCEANENNTLGAEVIEDKVKYKEKYPISECLEYMESSAYAATYGDKPVWHVYIRNFKGGFPPRTRVTCLTAKGKLITGNPCPICRDEYLLPHYLNIKLLKQFISPYGGNILETRKTGVCQTQQLNLKVAIKKAQNYGLLTFPIPHRSYNYSLYIKK